MTAAGRLHVFALAASAVMLCQQDSQHSAQNTGILVGRIRPYTSMHRQPVRLCSLERVLQTESEPGGAFTFADVPAGRYELVVGHPRLYILMVQEVEIQSGKTTTVTAIAEPRGIAGTICYRDTSLDCATTDFVVRYGEPSAHRTGNVSGQVIDRESSHKNGRIGKAQISIFKQGETTPLYTAVSDKHGRFQVDVRPGIYDLTMSLRGFQGVRVPDFLVPLQNETEIEIGTRKTEGIVVCQ